MRSFCQGHAEGPVLWPNISEYWEVLASTLHKKHDVHGLVVVHGSDLARSLLELNATNNCTYKGS